MGKQIATQNLIVRIYQNPKYKGKYVIVLKGKIYSAPTGRAKTRLLSKLLLRYPKETPTIIYVPKAESLVLFF